jgi:hypothetical protein
MTDSDLELAKLLQEEEDSKVVFPLDFSFSSFSSSSSSSSSSIPSSSSRSTNSYSSSSSSASSSSLPSSSSRVIDYDRKDSSPSFSFSSNSNTHSIQDQMEFDAKMAKDLSQQFEKEEEAEISNLHFNINKITAPRFKKKRRIIVEEEEEEKEKEKEKESENEKKRVDASCCIDEIEFEPQINSQEIEDISIDIYDDVGQVIQKDQEKQKKQENQEKFTLPKWTKDIICKFATNYSRENEKDEFVICALWIESFTSVLNTLCNDGYGLYAAAEPVWFYNVLNDIAQELKRKNVEIILVNDEENKQLSCFVANPFKMRCAFSSSFSFSTFSSSTKLKRD